MDPLRRFAAHAADFEKTFEDDDWTRLEGCFAEDAIYTVEGTPFDCEVRGRETILRAIKKSLDGFDGRFDKREIVLPALGRPRTLCVPALAEQYAPVEGRSSRSAR